MSQPQNLSVVDDTTLYELTLGWDAVSGVDGYNVYRAQSSGSSLSDYTKVAFTESTQYTDPELETGEKYYYRVTSVSSSESQPSTETSGVVPLRPPEGLEVSNITPTSADITWNNYVSGVTQRVYLEDLDNGGKADVSGDLDDATESYSLTELLKDTTYKVSVEAETTHTTSEDVTFTFDSPPGETTTENSVYELSGQYEAGGTLVVTE